MAIVAVSELTRTSLVALLVMVPVRVLAATPGARPVIAVPATVSWLAAGLSVAAVPVPEPELVQYAYAPPQAMARTRNMPSAMLRRFDFEVILVLLEGLDVIRTPCLHWNVRGPAKKIGRRWKHL